MKRENIAEVRKIISNLEFIENRIIYLGQTNRIKFSDIDDCELFDIADPSYIKGTIEWLKTKYETLKKELEDKLVEL